MPQRRPSRASGNAKRDPSVRIVGGEFRGRRIAYDGDPATRPMKDRVREAIFNILGPHCVRNATVIDLFAGTGALALEALSRGAARAIVIECNFRMARLLQDNVRTLNVADKCQVIVGDTFFWSPRVEVDPTAPWLIFCSPPYRLYSELREQLLGMLQLWFDRAPVPSTLVVEADNKFDFCGLPGPVTWQRRTYAPAEVAWTTKVD